MNRDQLYAMNIHYRYYDLEYFFRACQKMNLKHAELWLCPQHFYINSMWSESPEKLKGLMKQSGVQISCICPEQNNPKPNNIAARSELLIENTRKYFQNVIILASELGCDKILVTPGWNYHDEEVDEARKRSIRMLQSLCDIADPYGISLAMESIWDHSSDIANTKEKVKLIKDGVHSLERILYIVTLRMVSRQAVRPDICRGDWESGICLKFLRHLRQMSIGADFLWNMWMQEALGIPKSGTGRQ